MENFRNLLVMEDGDSPCGWPAPRRAPGWSRARGSPSRNAPTYFGTVAYEIVSDVDNGKITATVEMPLRKPPQEVLLRLRHPTAAPIKNVTINGQESKEFDAARELVRLSNVTGRTVVTASY